ncbi:hypothetical protein EMCRGX_G032795 [Ephydatia muelleri]
MPSASGPLALSKDVEWENRGVVDEELMVAEVMKQLVTAEIMEELVVAEVMEEFVVAEVMEELVAGDPSSEIGVANGGGVGKSVEQGVTSRKWKFGCLHGNSEHQGMLQRLVNAKPDHGLQSKPASVHLDDLLLVGSPGKDTCQEAMYGMLLQLGIPEKLEGSTTTLTFLGIVIVLNTSALPPPPTPPTAGGADRADQVLAIQAQGHQEGTTLVTLSFAAKVVPVGKLFFHHLRPCPPLSGSSTMHHISLNAEARADFMWWDSFPPSWNGVAMFLEPD